MDVCERDVVDICCWTGCGFGLNGLRSFSA